MAPSTEDKPLVCVTGATGFLAAHVVKQLLEKGHRVRGTVRSLENAEKLAPLRALPGALDALEFVKADMTDPNSFEAALRGCSALIHTATPVEVPLDGKPPASTMEEAEMLHVRPAVDGTIALLEAAAIAGIRKVILTASIASMRYAEPPHALFSEESWSDEEYARSQLLLQGNACYALVKTLQERAAWRVAEELGLKLVVINPALVIGPSLTPHLNFSLEALIRLIKGEGTGLDLCQPGTLPDVHKGWVDVREVSDAHVLAFENDDASGRYLLQSSIVHYVDVVSAMREHPKLRHYPLLPIDSSDGARHAMLQEMDNSKMKGLGVRTIPFAESISDSIDSLAACGFLK
jgi:nucleoside-diphosphate-sugar epimerase